MVETRAPPSAWATGGGSLPNGTRRNRDVFPLPRLQDVQSLRPGLSKSVRQRVLRRGRRAVVVNEVIDALNLLAAGSGAAAAGLPAAALQSSVQKQLFCSVSASLSLPSCTEQEAVNVLLSADLSYSGEEIPSTVVSYDRSLVSLPQVGAKIPELREVLDNFGRDFLADYPKNLLLSEAERGSLHEQGVSVKAYMDVRLRQSPQLYLQFLKDLVSRNMLGFTVEPIHLASPFFVAKKNGKQRLVWDCRESNLAFRQAAPLATATGASWANLQVPHEERLYIAQCDIADYFYHLGLPEELWCFFCLPPLPVADFAALFAEAEWTGRPRGLRDTEVWPCLKVVPMGWNWAMWFANRVHSHQALTGSELSRDRLITDQTAPPDLSSGEPVLLPYCDNLNVAGCDAAEVARARDLAASRLRSLGFVVHEETGPDLCATSLGYEINGDTGVVKPRPERLALVVAACRWLARGPRVFGWQLEKLLGHIIHVAIIRQPYLSIIRSLCDFAFHCRLVRTRLWGSACREAWLLAVLLPLVEAPLRLPWSPEVYLSDASLSGIAVGCASFENNQVALVGNRRERARFRADRRFRCARRHALAEAAASGDPPLVGGRPSWRCVLGGVLPPGPGPAGRSGVLLARGGSPRRAAAHRHRELQSGQT